VPLLWEGEEQPEGRWHREGRGPAQYASDTPEGAWTEFLRHEAITHPADLAGISRSLWALAVELDEEQLAEPRLPLGTLIGDRSSYPACQEEAERLRGDGATGLIAPAAALLSGGASGEVVQHGKIVPGPRTDGRTLCLFGPRPAVVGHRCVDAGRPPERVVELTRHFA
jgi:hypothetical protein